MPQMAPINWLILFIMFSVIFIMFNMMNYYYYIPKTQKSTSMLNLKFNSMNWKW